LLAVALFDFVVGSTVVVWLLGDVRALPYIWGHAYVAGDDLLEWLRRRSATLSASQVASLLAAISAVAADRVRGPTPEAVAV
jgi:hypothetical protein